MVARASRADLPKTLWEQEKRGEAKCWTKVVFLYLGWWQESGLRVGPGLWGLQRLG